MQQDAEKSERTRRRRSGFCFRKPSPWSSGRRSSPRREPTIDPFYVFVTLLLKKKKDFRDSNCINVNFDSNPIIVPVPSSNPVLTDPVLTSRTATTATATPTAKSRLNSQIPPSRSTLRTCVTPASHLRLISVAHSKRGVMIFYGDKNLNWRKNPDLKLKHFEKNEKDSDSNPRPPQEQKICDCDLSRIHSAPSLKFSFSGSSRWTCPVN